MKKIGYIFKIIEYTPLPRYSLLVRDRVPFALEQSPRSRLVAIVDLGQDPKNIEFWNQSIEEHNQKTRELETPNLVAFTPRP